MGSDGGSVPEVSDTGMVDGHSMSAVSIESQENSTMVPRDGLSQEVGKVGFIENPEWQVESEGSYSWNLENMSTLPKKLLSPSFKIGNYNWRILLYPDGNEPYEGSAVSLYVAADEQCNNLPEDWSICAQMLLTLRNPDKESNCLTKYTQHRFNSMESDWGFAQFCSNATLTDASNPLLAETGERLEVFVQMRIINDPLGILWHNFMNYNSKKVTGFVGLANQGATCYMNSLLQSLYLTNLFRKSIYMIPTENDHPTDCNALALQRIFYRLQYSDHPVSTQELTKSFGWDSLEAFVQSDVQEFSRVLLDDLENRTKGTRAEGFIEKMFVGKVRNVISCVNVPFSSKRTESFYDLQLTIKDMRTLEESFDMYVKEEKLEGDNKYHAEGYGLQDARKYIEFEQFPPVLHLHLERYTFDPRVMGTVKINDRLEFPLRVNLNKYLAEDSPQKNEPQDYILQSVFVHSGDSHGGHYYVFIRDPRDDNGRWYRFDDTKVIPATAKEAVEDNFGGLESGDSVPTYGTRSSRWEKYKRFTNAYMLVYIRESDLESILCPIDPSVDIPPHVGAAIRAEEEEDKKRRQERHLQLTTAKVSILTDEHVKNHVGFDLYNFDNRNLPSNTAINQRVDRNMTLGSLKTAMSEAMVIPADQLRFWTFALRHNKTIRLEAIVDENRTIGSLAGKSPVRSQSVTLYLERIDESSFKVGEADQHVIFFKYLDCQKGVVRPVGHLSINGSDMLSSLKNKLCLMADVPLDSQLDFFEEIKPTRIDPLQDQRTITECGLQTGDIVCFQLSNNQSLSVPEYFKSIFNMVFVQVNLTTDEEGSPGWQSRVPLSLPFATFVESLAKEYNKPVTHLRFYMLDELGDNPSPLKGVLEGNATIESVFRSSDPPSNVDTQGICLLMEETPIPAVELAVMKRLQILILKNFVEPFLENFSLLISPEDTMADVFEGFPENVKKDLSGSEYRLVETMNHRVVKVYSSIVPDTTPFAINESHEVYLDQNSREISALLVAVFNYFREPSRTHSIPFMFPLLPNEPFALTKQRLLAFMLQNCQSKITLNSLEVEKWSFAIVTFGREKSIGDDDVLASYHWSEHDQLGINRPDPFAPIGTKSASFNNVGERGIKIRSSTPGGKPQTSSENKNNN